MSEQNKKIRVTCRCSFPIYVPVKSLNDAKTKEIICPICKAKLIAPSQSQFYAKKRWSECNDCGHQFKTLQGSIVKTQCPKCDSVKIHALKEEEKK